MECNRDEALRAKEIAERKFNARDFSGAKKFALKAQNLFPALEGINQMIATMDVYLAGELKVNGERDWYAILSVQALADEETVKKRYRKLALQLHPDKNKSLGAEGAFQLISEAWSVLSDKSRKLLYDAKVSVKGCQQKASQAHRDQSVSNTANGFYNFTNKTKSHTRNHRKSNSSSRSAAPTPRPPKADTFWTSCHRCKMQYEYLRMYLNHNLLCPNCKEPFLAIEIGFPSNGTNCNASWSASQHRQHNVNHNSSVNDTYDAGRNQNTATGMGSTVFQHGTNYDVYANQNYNWGPFSRTAGAASANASSASAAQAANMVHHTYEKVRRDREEAQAAAKKEEALKRRNHAPKRNHSTSSSGTFNAGAGGSVHDRDRPGKRRRSITDDSGTNYVGVEMEQMVQGTVKSGSNISGLKMPYNLSRETAQLDIRSMLMEKAKAGIKRKLEEWNTAAVAKLAEKEKVKQKQKRKENDNGKLPAVASGNEESTEKENGVQVSAKKDPSNNHSSDSEKGKIEPVSIDVPDPDFHDFDKDRSEKAFDSDQVWATYDGEDGMPRVYALVQKVISLKPFKIRMSFLTSKTNSEFGTLNWVGSGFAKTCGDFRVGRYEVNDTVNIFSHKVQWEKGSRGVIKILPRKGDIWAVYKNWSPDWNEHTPDDVIYKYEMVEVLDDYNDEQGVSVTPLVKVAGFKTVFHRHMDPKETRRIPKEEMFRFSHQVPSYILTGEEAHNAPKGCRELDPAATPVELLQVITEVKEHEPMETDEQQPVS